MIRFLAASPRGPALSSRDAAPAALIILRYALRAGYSSSGGGVRRQTAPRLQTGHVRHCRVARFKRGGGGFPPKKRGLVSCRVDALKRDPEY